MLDCSEKHPGDRRHTYPHIFDIDNALYKALVRCPSTTTELDALADRLIAHIIKHGGAILPSIGSPAFQYILHCRLQGNKVTLQFKPHNQRDGHTISFTI